MTKTVKKRKLSRRILRKLVIFVIALLLLYGGLYIYDGFYHGQKPQATVLSYNVNQSASYKVNLIENSFFDDLTKNENDSYVSELIKTIDAKFNYEYLMSKNGHIEYTYSIIGYLVGDYKSSADNEIDEVWKKEIVYVGKTTITDNNKSALRIDKDIEIDYPTINQQVIDFKNELKLPINAYLNLTFEINLKAHVDEEVITDHERQVIKIPCNLLAFNISKTVPGNKQDKITYTLPFDSINEKNLIIGISLTSFALILFIFNFKMIFKIKHRTTYYNRLDKILKTYSDIIVELATPLDDRGLSVVHVTTFNELMDLEEELRIPINYYEYEPGYEAEFSIIHNNMIYKYIFNVDSK